LRVWTFNKPWEEGGKGAVQVGIQAPSKQKKRKWFEEGPQRAKPGQCPGVTKPLA